MHRTLRHPNATTYDMIGTLTPWTLYPSANAAPAHGHCPARVIGLRAALPTRYRELPARCWLSRLGVQMQALLYNQGLCLSASLLPAF